MGLEFLVRLPDGCLGRLCGVRKIKAPEGLLMEILFGVWCAGGIDDGGAFVQWRHA
jgi:hypothetical protein